MQVKAKWRPFREAREYVRALGLRNVHQWRAWAASSERPTDVPSAPQQVYKDAGWEGFGDWLGNEIGSRAGHKVLPFEDARAFVHSLGLKSVAGWNAWCKDGGRDASIPAAPDKAYASLWKGWGDWLGSGNTATRTRRYIPFDEARALVHLANLKSKTEWSTWSQSGQKPEDIPANPARTYAFEGWRGWGEGQKLDHVDVILPQVVLRAGEETWSWDVQRRDRIAYKKTLADATVDGAIPEGVLESESAMLSRALQALHAWIDRLEHSDTLHVVNREPLAMPLPVDEKRRGVRIFGDFATMNARLNNAHSSTTHTSLVSDPDEWYLYHTLYREARAAWPEVPYQVFAAWLQVRPHLVVADFGCGEALLAASISNKVYSFDHIAINDQVTACDMAHTNLDDGILDVAIFSLSLMGSNVEDYLREAHRLLKLDGRLKIAEPASHWEGVRRQVLLGMIGSLGFQLIGSMQERGRFIYIDALKTS